MKADQPEKTRVAWTGRHLEARITRNWEYVSRPNISGVVGVVAITAEERLVVVEQFRPPAGRPVMELPAGLAGDESGSEHESLLVAAQRELLEETGYEADEWRELLGGFSSPGLTDEHVALFLARKLRKTGPGGGDANESIRVHEVALAELPAWIVARSQQGFGVDLKLLAGLQAASFDTR